MNTAKFNFYLQVILVLFGAGMGWWFSIALIAAISEQILVLNVIPHLKAMKITFIMNDT